MLNNALLLALPTFAAEFEAKTATLKAHQRDAIASLINVKWADAEKAGAKAGGITPAELQALLALFTTLLPLLISLFGGG